MGKSIGDTVNMGEINNESNAKTSSYARNIVISYADFLRKSNLNPQHYDCDVLVLKMAVKRYLGDVRRLHDYHDIQYIDCYKIAGYLSYWICKLKPFRVKNKVAAYTSNSGYTSPTDIAKKSFFINELFSVHLGQSRINAHHKIVCTDRRLSLSEETIETLTYTLKYRPTSGDMLMVMFQMADAAYAVKS